MQWVVVYDFASDWFNPLDWLSVAFEFAFIVTGLFLARAGRWLAALFVFVAPLVFTVPMFQHQWETYRALSQAYRDNTYSVVEGVVENFRSVCDGRTGEDFTVNGVPFHYGPAEIHMGFGQSQTACHGGPMRAGLYVRVGYVQRPSGIRHILRLEIRR